MRSSRPRAPEAAAPSAPLRFRSPRLMGGVIVTPDSFKTNTQTATPNTTNERGLKRVAEGADFLDVGGQSTRPGSDAVALEDELARVIPVISALSKRTKVPISIDTDKARVAAEALDAGARIVNDVTALRGDRDMPRVAARAERVVLMHMLGESPKTMQADPRYGDVVGEVREFLAERLDAFAAAGGDRARAWIDPGIGFGKTAEQNLALIRRAGELCGLAPGLLGVSRKSFLSKISPDGGPVDRRPGSLAAALRFGLAGVVVLRVHDVEATKKALATFAAAAGAR